MKTLIRKQPFPHASGRGLMLVLPVLLMLAFSPLRPESRDTQSAAHQQAAPGSGLGAQSVYDVAIILLNISSIDISAGSYDLDFYISLYCAEPPCASEPNWDIMNTMDKIEPELQGAPIPFQEYHYRVKAKLLGYIDYTFYPFDYLLVDLYIEDKELGSSSIAYRLSSITADEYLFDPKGWNYTLDPNAWKTEDVLYSFDAETYSRLNVSLLLEREWGGAFMKTLFAAIVIVLIGLLAFLMRHDESTERLALTSSTMLGIILYNLSITANLPTIGYMTFTDKFMVACYVTTFLSLLISVLLMVLINQGQHEQAQRLHRTTRWVVPSLWIIAIALVFILELFAPYRAMFD